MRRTLLYLLCLMLPAAAMAQEKQDKPILVLEPGGHTGDIKTVRFTPDGKQLISVSSDKTIRIWDVETGSMLRVLRPPIYSGGADTGALSPDGQTLAVGRSGPQEIDHWIYLIALSSGHIEGVLKGHPNGVSSVAFSPDGKRLAAGSDDGTARIWDLENRRCAHVLHGHSASVTGVAFSPDGRHLATASWDGTASIWSVATGESECSFQKDNPPPHVLMCLAWSPDGKTLVTGGMDRLIRLWNQDGTLRKRYNPGDDIIRSISLGFDSRQLLLAGRDSRVLDLETGKERTRCTLHRSLFVSTSALSPDGRLAATVGFGDELYLWKTTDGSLVHHLTGLGGDAYGAAWSRDGKRVAWGNTRRKGDDEPTPWGDAGDVSVPLNVPHPLERTFNIADLEFGSAPDDDFQRFQAPPEGLSVHKIVSKGYVSIIVQDGAETVSSLASPGPSYSSPGASYSRSYTFPSEERIALAGSTIWLFEARTGKLLRRFQGNSGYINAVSSSPDGRYLLTSSSDQTVRIWALDRDTPLLSFFFAGDEWIAWTPEGYYAASPGGETLMGWQINNGPEEMASFYPAAEFRKSLYRPDVMKRLLDAGSVEKALAQADEARGKASEQIDVSQVLPPSVAITSPDQTGFKVSKPELEVHAVAISVGDHPVTAIRLLLDGRPYQGDAGVKKIANPKLGQVKESWTVQLSFGNHQLAVQAESAVSKAVSDPVEVICEGSRGLEVIPDEAEKKELLLPSLYVLAIGVSDYPGDLKLHYAAKDAETLAQTYRDKAPKLFRKVEVKLLTDQQATRRNILKGLTWLHQQMTQNDVAVFSFAGHGAKDADGKFYILPVDGEMDDLLSTAVAGDQLKGTLASIPGKIVAMLDACHAGAVDGEKRRGDTSLTDDLVRDLVTDDYGVIVMCSAMGREYAMESPSVEHGYFTLAIVEGLSGKADYNHDGVVQFDELDLYVTDRVKELAQGKQHPVTAKPTSIRSFPMSKP